MATWMIILLLTLSSSIDNLGAALAYGIKGVKICFTPNLIIAITGFTFSLVGIYFGMWIGTLLPGIMPALVAVVLLCFIGIRLVLLTQKNQDQAQISMLGYGEAVLFGIALSANALVNGVSAGLIGLSPFIISIFVAAGSFIAVLVGSRIGLKAKEIHIGRYTVGQFGTIISGLILMIVGIGIFL